MSKSEPQAFLVSPRFTRESLRALPHEAPFYALDLDVLTQRYRELAAVEHGLTLHYAVKANPERAVVEHLRELGSSFEIASVGELELLRGLGVSASRILFSNPVKAPAAIRHAWAAGVRAFVFDSEGELPKLAKEAPGAHVYLRLAVPDEHAQFPLSIKFGAAPSSAVSLFQKARQLGLEPWGLQFHVGSQCERLEPFENGVRLAAAVMRELDASGVRLEVLNTGGGFPALYGPPVPSLRSVVRALAEAGRNHLPYPVRLLCEPGRGLVANAAVLVTNVLGRVQRGPKTWLHLDVGVFHGLLESIEAPWRTAFAIRSEREGNALAPFTLTGPTCDGVDVLGHDLMLDANTDAGDRLHIASAGAYTTSLSSSFNGFAMPPTFVV